MIETACRITTNPDNSQLVGLSIRYSFWLTQREAAVRTHNSKRTLQATCHLLELHRLVPEELAAIAQQPDGMQVAIPEVHHLLTEAIALASKIRQPTVETFRAWGEIGLYTLSAGNQSPQVLEEAQSYLQQAICDFSQLPEKSRSSLRNQMRLAEVYVADGIPSGPNDLIRAKSSITEADILYENITVISPKMRIGIALASAYTRLYADTPATEDEPQLYLNANYHLDVCSICAGQIQNPEEQQHIKAAVEKGREALLKARVKKIERATPNLAINTDEYSTTHYSLGDSYYQLAQYAFKRNDYDSTNQLLRKALAHFQRVDREKLNTDRNLHHVYSLWGDLHCAYFARDGFFIDEEVARGYYNRALMLAYVFRKRS